MSQLEQTIEQLVAALLTSLDPTVSAKTRSECLQYLEQVHSMPNRIELAMNICLLECFAQLSFTNMMVLKNFALLVLESSLKSAWDTFDVEQQQCIKTFLLSLASSHSSRFLALGPASANATGTSQARTTMKKKLAGLIACVGLREWPVKWPELSSLFMGLSSRTAIEGISLASTTENTDNVTPLEVACLCFRDLADTVFLHASETDLLQEERKAELSECMMRTADSFLPGMIAASVEASKMVNSNSIGCLRLRIIILEMLSSCMGWCNPAIFIGHVEFIALISSGIVPASNSDACTEEYSRVCFELAEVMLSRRYGITSADSILNILEVVPVWKQAIAAAQSVKDSQALLNVLRIASLYGMEQLFPVKNGLIRHVKGTAAVNKLMAYLDIFLSGWDPRVIQVHSLLITFWAEFFTVAPSQWTSELADTAKESLVGRLLQVISVMLSTPSSTVFRASDDFLSLDSREEALLLIQQSKNKHSILIQAFLTLVPKELCQFCIPPFLEHALRQSSWDSQAQRTAEALAFFLESIIKGSTSTTAQTTDDQNISIPEVLSEYLSVCLATVCAFQNGDDTVLASGCAESMCYQAQLLALCLKFNRSTVQRECGRQLLPWPEGWHALYGKMFKLLQQFAQLDSVVSAWRIRIRERIRSLFEEVIKGMPQQDQQPLASHCLGLAHSDFILGCKDVRGILVDLLLGLLTRTPTQSSGSMAGESVHNQVEVAGSNTITTDASTTTVSVDFAQTTVGRQVLGIVVSEVSATVSRLQSLSQRLSPESFLHQIGFSAALRKATSITNFKTVKFLEGDLSLCGDLHSSLSGLLNIANKVAIKESIWLNCPELSSSFRDAVAVCMNWLRFLLSIPRSTMVRSDRLSFIFSSTFCFRVSIIAYTTASHKNSANDGLMDAQSAFLEGSSGFSDSTMESYLNRLSAWWDSCMKACIGVLSIGLSVLPDRNNLISELLAQSPFPPELFIHDLRISKHILDKIADKLVIQCRDPKQLIALVTGYLRPMVLTPLIQGLSCEWQALVMQESGSTDSCSSSPGADASFCSRLETMFPLAEDELCHWRRKLLNESAKSMLALISGITDRLFALSEGGHAGMVSSSELQSMLQPLLSACLESLNWDDNACNVEACTILIRLFDFDLSRGQVMQQSIALILAHLMALAVRKVSASTGDVNDGRTAALLNVLAHAFLQYDSPNFSCLSSTTANMSLPLDIQDLLTKCGRRDTLKGRKEALRSALRTMLSLAKDTASGSADGRIPDHRSMLAAAAAAAFPKATDISSRKGSSSSGVIKKLGPLTIPSTDSSSSNFHLVVD